MRKREMEKGGLGRLPFVCCVFITYTRELRGTPVSVCSWLVWLVTRSVFVGGVSACWNSPRHEM